MPLVQEIRAEEPETINSEAVDPFDNRRYEADLGYLDADDIALDPYEDEVFDEYFDTEAAEEAIEEAMDVMPNQPLPTLLQPKQEPRRGKKKPSPKKSFKKAA